MIKYRPPVGSYAEAMEKVVEISDLPALVNHINENVLAKGIDELVSLGGIGIVRHPELEFMELHDSRNGWDTHIVVHKGRNGIYGHTDGVFSND